MLDRYIDRPNVTFANGRYTALDKFCNAEFLRYYYLLHPNNENDWQPEELLDEFFQLKHDGSSYPHTIPLMASKEKLKCRMVPAVLWFYKPNKEKNFELFADNLLFLFFPFRDENELKLGDPPSYAN